MGMKSSGRGAITEHREGAGKIITAQRISTVVQNCGNQDEQPKSASIKTSMEHVVRWESN
jgi:hypothetical protein